MVRLVSSAMFLTTVVGDKNSLKLDTLTSMRDSESLLPYISNNTGTITHTQLTKEICVQILAMSISKALGGCALLLNSLFSSIWIDQGHDDNPGLVDELKVKMGRLLTNYNNFNT